MIRVLRTIPFAVLAICAAGCGGCSTPGESTSASSSLSGITPGTAFLGRTTEVMISGVGTHFAGQPRISFNDPAFKATRVDVLSDTSLRAAIEIGEDASSGPHDVSVTTPGIGDTKEETAMLKGGLVASAPLKHEVKGTVTQGGLVDFAVMNLDKESAFVGAPTFLGGAVAARITEVTPMRIAGTLLVDPLAPLGPLKIRFSARTLRGDSVTFVSAREDPSSPDVTPSKPILALVPGKVEGNEAISAPHHANVYRATVPGVDHVFFLGMATVGASLKSTSGARLVGAMAPASGRFGEGSTFETTFDNAIGGRGAVGLLQQAGDAYFAVHTSDLSGGPSEYSYSLKLGLAKGTSFSMKEPEPPDSPVEPTAAIDVDGPVFAIDGAIDVRDDADYVIVTPKKAGRLFIAAVPVASSVPLNVSIFGNDPGSANCSAFVAGGMGTKQAEINAAAGTPYCVRINTTTPLTAAYHLVISPEL